MITLTGNVPSSFEKHAAEKVAGRVAGVIAIAKELIVNLRANCERTDTDIVETSSEAPREGQKSFASVDDFALKSLM